MGHISSKVGGDGSEEIVYDEWRMKRVNYELKPGRPNGPIGESKMPTYTRPKKVGPILSHGPPVGTKAQTCPPRLRKLALQE